MTCIPSIRTCRIIPDVYFFSHFTGYLLQSARLNRSSVRLISSPYLYTRLYYIKQKRKLPD